MIIEVTDELEEIMDLGRDLFSADGSLTGGYLYLRGLRMHGAGGAAPLDLWRRHWGAAIFTNHRRGTLRCGCTAVHAGSTAGELEPPRVAAHVNAT